MDIFSLPQSDDCPGFVGHTRNAEAGGGSHRAQPRRRALSARRLGHAPVCYEQRFNNDSSDGGDEKRPRADWPASDTGAVEGQSAPPDRRILGVKQGPLAHSPSRCIFIPRIQFGDASSNSWPVPA